MEKIFDFFHMDPFLHFCDMKIFGVQWFIWFAVFIIGTFFLSKLARKKGRDFAKKLLFWIMIGTLAVYCWYKVVLVYAPGYSEVLLSIGKPKNNIWNELPLHLCNVNMILIPIGIWKERKSILGFSLCMAPLGALMAVVTPCAGFDGYSIFLPRVFGYFFTHFMILFAGIWIYTFGIYKPTVRDVPKVVIAMFAIYTIVFAISEAIRALELYEAANYFYSFYHDDIGPLKLFWNLIPMPYLYLLPAIAILIPYLFAVVGITTLCDKLRYLRKAKT